ncbi:AraC family transcriptional regulator [Bradyrhizobium sp. SRS-191]|uniref:helix-turn-helix transcriptional regulator n=1 Tax=Bradyrhizobium sp. SRS-191 TaxID=2962606 RepID=UPI00211EDE6E|nr:AraC family transcriptional regulator [Bradyrhizobium sp. SRS-191]
MVETETFGKRLKVGLRLEQAPTLVTRAFADSALVAAECRSDHPQKGLSNPLPPDDAYMVSVKFRDYPECECWENGRAVAKKDIFAGGTYLYDMKRAPCYVIDKPFHSIFFRLSREVIDVTAREMFMASVGELSYEPAVGVDDPIMRHLSNAMGEALGRPSEANRLFVDHLSMTIAAHVVRTYGRCGEPAALLPGGLAPWQVRRACGLIEARLSGNILLEDISSELDLSPSYFARAFKKSVGVAPHQWLLQRRVARARDLLVRGELSLGMIALEVGFADQSHFTRTFTRLVGISPSRWRRSNGDTTSRRIPAQDTH